MRRTYTRFSRTWYWEANQPANDCINVMAGETGGGGVRYEFEIECHVFTDDKTGIQVKVFNDAFQAFKDFKDIFKAIKISECKTLDEVENVLLNFGVEDTTKTTRN